MYSVRGHMAPRSFIKILGWNGTLRSYRISLMSYTNLTAWHLIPLFKILILYCVNFNGTYTKHCMVCLQFITFRQGCAKLQGGINYTLLSAFILIGYTTSVHSYFLWFCFLILNFICIEIIIFVNYYKYFPLIQYS